MAIFKFKLEMKQINAYLIRQTTSLNIVRSSLNIVRGLVQAFFLFIDFLNECGLATDGNKMKFTIYRSDVVYGKVPDVLKVKGGENGEIINLFCVADESINAVSEVFQVEVRLLCKNS